MASQTKPTSKAETKRLKWAGRQQAKAKAAQAAEAKAFVAKLNAEPTRVDPSDGRAYTLTSFRRQYGADADRLWAVAGEAARFHARQQQQRRGRARRGSVASSGSSAAVSSVADPADVPLAPWQDPKVLRRARARAEAEQQRLAVAAAGLTLPYMPLPFAAAAVTAEGLPPPPLLWMPMPPPVW